MSKESKLAKKELKAQKKAAKLEKKQEAAYAKLCKDIEKKNVKLEKKSSKKGVPFVPIAIPTMEEAFAAGKENKAANIVKMIVLLLLICYIIYFLVMWFQYVAPPKPVEDNETSVTEYERYVNIHEITTTPDYTVAEAKAVLKQVLKDNYKEMGFNYDPSSNAINYTGSIKTINNQDCYEFTASGKTFEVSIKLSGVYLNDNGKYIPYTFHGTEYLEFKK